MQSAGCARERPNSTSRRKKEADRIRARLNPLKRAAHSAAGEHMLTTEFKGPNCTRPLEALIAECALGRSRSDKVDFRRARRSCFPFEGPVGRLRRPRLMFHQQLCLLRLKRALCGSQTVCRLPGAQPFEQSALAASARTVSTSSINGLRSTDGTSWGPRAAVSGPSRGRHW